MTPRRDFVPGGQADGMDNQEGKMDVCAHGDQRARICEGLACGGRGRRQDSAGGGVWSPRGSREGFALPTPPLEQGET